MSLDLFYPFTRTTSILSAKLRFPVQVAMAIVLSICLSACDSNLNSDPANGGSGEPPMVDPGPGDGSGSASNSALSLQIGTGSILLIEGGESVSVTVTLTRKSAQTSNVSLAAQGMSDPDDLNLSSQLLDVTLSGSQNSTTMTLQLAIGARPLKSETRVYLVTVDDGSTPLTAKLIIQVQPTDRPDVYLLVGQSNMMGFSENDSKQAQLGQPDAPNERIKQLNVTGNDDQNFAVEADFTNPVKIYNAGEPLTPAVDPLHDGYNSQIGGKGGNRIGPGLSFAKQALADTTVDIYLVPTAWSDTGFCKRISNRLPGIGWNATVKTNAALSGTLLHDRAIARANIALDETGGILRGILWHQGEADSDTAACAQVYADNLTELAASLRSHINQDARGPSARGSSADIPFIVGTMSMGSDSTSSQIPFSESKLLVDAAHRSVATLIPMSGFVNNDDLLPPDYPCGEGSCIHFGALAYREMGKRYYLKLEELLPKAE